MLNKLIFGLLGLMLLISSAGATSTLTIGTPTYSSSVLKDESFTVEVPIQAASVSSQITVTVTLIDNTNGVTITSAVKTISYSSDGTQNIQWSVKANNPGTYSNPFTIQATASDGGQASPLTSTTSLSIKDRPVLTVNVSQNTTSVSPNGYVRLEYTITNIASPEAASATDMNASLSTIPEGWTVISPTNYGISSLSAGGSQTSGYFIVMAPAASSNYVFNLSVTSAQGDSIAKSWNIEVEGEGSPGLNITGYAPASPATDTTGATRAFNVTVDQTANVTWYINGIQVQYNTSTTDATYTNTSASAGTWTVNATANNTNGTVSREWTWTVSDPAAGSPGITGSAPTSPVNDTPGATRAFNVTANQTVNVTWYINGTQVQYNTSTTDATYTNTSAVAGTWTVNATVNNTNGAVSREWTWIVLEQISILDMSPNDNDIINTKYVNVTVTLSRAGNATLKWNNGTNESMDGSGTEFYKNKSVLLSGNYSFIAYANDSLGSVNASETRTVIVNLTSTTNLSANIDPATGNLSQTVNLTAPSENATLTIFNGTNATLNGTAITNITIDSLNSVNSTFVANLGSDKLIGENLSLGPEGARFSPDIQIRFNYTDAMLSAAQVSASGLRIKLYNTSTNAWDVQTPYTLNETGKYIIANVSHFSTYALIAAPAATTSPGSSGSSSGGTGGGGGGTGSAEKGTNIEVSEKYDMQISKGATTSYKFTNKKNPIMFVNITGAMNMGIITTSVEVLKNTSTIVKTPAGGPVYKNINIWVGTTGFATSKNIKEALIKFRVDNAWMSANSVEGSDIVLVKWDGTTWKQIETKVLSKDDASTYFEGKTDSFSPFAITAMKNAVVPEPVAQDTGTKGTQEPVGTESATSTPAKKTYGFGFVLAILVLVLSAAYLFRQNRR